MLLYSYKQGSKSANALADALNIKKIKHENSKFKGNYRKTVVNWGASSVPDEVACCRILNAPERVKLACDKLSFFKEMKEQPVNTPEFFTDFQEVFTQLREGKTILARTILNGHSGKGIVVMSPDTPVKSLVDDAPLYSRYIKKKDEYRVHVVADEAVDIQRKALAEDQDRDNVNWQIRNHDNGFIYVRNDVEPPEKVVTQAVLAVGLCGLDFAAVDVVWNEHEQEAYVLEVNTAPGLEGQTVDTYANAIRRSF